MGAKWDGAQSYSQNASVSSLKTNVIVGKTGAGCKMPIELTNNRCRCRKTSATLIRIDLVAEAIVSVYYGLPKAKAVSAFLKCLTWIRLKIEFLQTVPGDLQNNVSVRTSNSYRYSSL